MRTVWKWSLALSLGFLATEASGGEQPLSAHRSGPTGPGAVTTGAAGSGVLLGRPVVAGSATPAPATSTPTAGASLARPVAFPGAATSGWPAASQEPGLQQVTFGGQRPGAVIRGQSPDNPISRVQSVAPEVAQPSQHMFAWRKAEDAYQAPMPARVSPPVVESAGPIMGSPAPIIGSSGPIMGSPAPVVVGDDCFASQSCAPGACAPAACENGACFADCPCDMCGGDCYFPSSRFWVGAEYLLWWTKGSNIPPLVTTGGVNDAIPGAIGQSGTRVLFGSENILGDPRSGIRVSGGYWLTDDHSFGLDASAFYLTDDSEGFQAASTGTPVLARPFVDFTPGSGTFGQENSQLKAFPGLVGGSVFVNQDTTLWGGDFNLRTNLCCDPCCSVDLLVGYRGMKLTDDLVIGELIVSQDPTAPGAALITDQFSTRNRFHGGQIGLATEWRRGKWTFGLKTKVAMGNTHQEVSIRGATQIEGSGTTADGRYNTGILATRSNIGDFNRDRFTVIPEVGVDIGYQLTDHLRCFMGYNFMYWSSVLRPGDQIDRGVDTNQWAPPIADGSRPAFDFHGTGYWAQGLTFGLEFRY